MSVFHFKRSSVFFTLSLFSAVLSSEAVQAAGLRVAPDQAFTYQGYDELGQTCSFTVVSNNAAVITIAKLHGNAYIDGIIPRLGSGGLGGYVVEDSGLIGTDQFTTVTFRDFDFGDGVHINVHQGNPPGVIKMEGDLSIDLSGTSLDALSAVDEQGGSIAFYGRSLCHDLTLTTP